MTVLPFGEWRPDVSDYQGQTTKNIINVVPRGDGYGPVNSPQPISNSLPAACRGYFYARKNDGSIAIFAGTSTRLYQLNNTDGSWTDVSKSGAAYSALSSGAQWQFAQFNNLVIAVQQNTVPQVFDLTSASAFVDLGGSPPQAAYIAIINRFVVLSGLLAPNVYRVQWSGLNDTTQWTSGVNQSDFQDLADGGIVRGVAGGESGVILQDSSIRRMTFAPGSPYVFSIERISSDDGSFAPYSILNAGDRVFFCSPQGFKMLVPGGYPTPIGKERIDRTFFLDVDSSNLQLFIGSSDPRNSRVFWAYKSVNGTTGQFDKLLCYDWVLDKWTPLIISGEYMATMSRPGLTLEQVDDVYGTDIDTIDIGSLDDISIASLSSLSIMDTQARLAFLTGDNLEATLETPEQGDSTQRIFVRGFRPICDASSIFGSTSQRENAQTASVYSDEVTVNAQGYVPQHASTRYARAKIRIPVSTEWTFAAGVDPDVVEDGQR